MAENNTGNEQAEDGFEKDTGYILQDEKKRKSSRA